MTKEQLEIKLQVLEEVMEMFRLSGSIAMTRIELQKMIDDTKKEFNHGTNKGTGGRKAIWCTAGTFICC